MADQLPRLPANAGAERAILGSIVIDNTLINNVIEKLKADDFYYPKHRIIYQAMLDLSADHEPIDYQTLNAYLDRQKVLEQIGGNSFIMDLTAEPYYTANIDSYIDIVHNHSLQRALVSFADSIKGHALDGEDPAIRVLAEAEQALIDIGEMREGSGLSPLSDSLAEAMTRISDLSMSDGSLTGIPSGFRELDKQLSGFQKSDLILLAARPSMGKTALGLNFAFNAARFQDKKGDHPYKVAIFSLEMSKLQLSQRLLAMASGLDLANIIAGDIKEDSDWEQLFQGVEELKHLPIYIDDTSSISVQELRSKCRRLKMEEGLDFIVIDYLQLMSADNARSNENRQQEITQISRGLKALAKEMNCPVLALSQLSRKTESREKSRPMMSDMRESGSIEQDADIVMLLYREDYYEADTDKPNITEVIVAKHRNGPTGMVELYFEKSLTRFKDLNYVDESKL